MSTTEDSVSIISFDDGLYLEDALPGSDIGIQHWLSQQCRFALQVDSNRTKAKDKLDNIGPYGPGPLLSSVLMKQSMPDEAALRADSPLLGFGDERALMDPLHFPSATYVRDLPADSKNLYRKHSPHSSRSSSTSSSRHARSQSSVSRRPSLLRQPSLPLLGEEPHTFSVSQAGRSRAESNVSISSFHLPTSMQLTAPASSSSRRLPNTPPVSSTLASFSFGADSDAVRPPIPRSHSQLHLRHHNQPPPSISPQKIPRALSRSSSTLSLSLLTSSRNAVYIDDLIDINSVEDLVAEADTVDSLVVIEGDRLHEEAHTPLIPPNAGVYFNAIRSASQVYLGSSSGSGAGAKKPTRPPLAPPLIMDGDIEVADDKGGLGGVGVVDEDAISSGGSDADEKKKNQFGEEHSQWRGCGANGGPGVYPNYPRPPRRQNVEFEESDVIPHESDVEPHYTDTDGEGDNDKPFTSRWSLTSSIDDNPPSGGGIFTKDRERKRKSLGGYREKGFDNKEKTDKKRGRLVSFISRISSNIASPPTSPQHAVANHRPSSSSSLSFRTHDGSYFNSESTLLHTTPGPWFGDVVPPSGGASGQQQFDHLPKTVPDNIASSPPTSPGPSPSLDPYSKGLKHVASPIAKVFSDGFGGAASALDFMGVRSPLGSTVVDRSGVGASAMERGMVRVRSNSAADILARSAGGSSGGGGEYHDSYQYRQRQEHNGYQHQQTQGQQVPSQVRRYTSAYLYTQPQPRQYGYSSELSGYQSHQQQYGEYARQRRQSQVVQSHQQYRPVTGGGYGEGSSSLSSSVTALRPGLVKSVSTSMLNMVSGGGGFQYGNAARRDADLPTTSVSSATTEYDDRGDGEVRRREEKEDEEEDYGVEAAHGQWRGGCGVGLAYDGDRDTTMRLEIERAERWDSLRHKRSQLGLEEHSAVTTTAATTSPTPTTTTNAAPTPTLMASVGISPSSSATPSLKNSSSSSIVTKTQDQIQYGLEKRQTLRSMPGLGNGNEVVAAMMPMPTVKTGNGSSKGFRGFVERIKFTTSSSSSSSSSPSPSSSSSSPIIPLEVSTNIVPATSTTPLFTTAAIVASDTSSDSQSPTTSFVMGGSSSAGGPLFFNDGLFGSDKQKKKKQPKRKLVINGVNEDDVKGLEAVKVWCESFGEIREMKRTKDGYLHVDFKKASVAETVCRLKTQVFIKGAGSVSLSWYTKESKGLLLQG